MPYFTREEFERQSSEVRFALITQLWWHDQKHPYDLRRLGPPHEAFISWFLRAMGEDVEQAKHRFEDALAFKLRVQFLKSLPYWLMGKRGQNAKHL